MDQYRAGRMKLLEMSYQDFEDDIIKHFDGMLGPHGFDVERDMAGITLNRWPHGYAYEFEGIGINPSYKRYNGPHIAGRAQIGRISIANSTQRHTPMWMGRWMRLIARLMSRFSWRRSNEER